MSFDIFSIILENQDHNSFREFQYLEFFSIYYIHIYALHLFIYTRK